MDWLALAGALAALLALGLLLVSLMRAKREAGRFAVLDELARVSDGADDLETTLEAVAEILVPRVADFCMIDMVSEGEVKRETVRIAPGAPARIGSWLESRQPSLPPEMGAAVDGKATEPRFYERFDEKQLSELARNEEDLELFRELAPRSAITCALRARGKVIGTLTLGTAWSRRRYRDHDARFARVLAGRVALAMDNAGLFAHLERAQAEQTEIAATLQRGLAPPSLPQIPGWSAATMYRPAGAENEVGGDFYDAFRIPDGWMLVIGDVTGRGARAASVTAVARYTLRTAAALSGDPLVALTALNSALLAREDTALCGVVAFAIPTDPTRPVRHAVAGHLPPLLVDAGRVSYVSESGPVLGAFEHATWELTETTVDPGQQLVAVTDGVIEASGAEGRFGEERLQAELSRAASPATAVSRLEEALLRFSNDPLEDDAAALALAPAA
ncbi:MAG TPA: GAF domain-containing SpoIIE family protein phosphatase [Solirubrobacterales bacterium]|nr:GAF domain-containing SpoIIE family protein phosphatase [Solirubrobacterales bacterium]